MPRRETRTGRRPPAEPYPRSVAECIVEGRRYKPAALAAMRRFRAARPWRGTPAERQEKLAALHAELCAAYGVRTQLYFRRIRGRDTRGSYYNWLENVICVEGGLSVVTYLHEFGHALGYGERGACVWSINLFRRIFPRSFARLRHVGHLLRRDDT